MQNKIGEISGMSDYLCRGVYKINERLKNVLNYSDIPDIKENGDTLEYPTRELFWFNTIKENWSLKLDSVSH